MLVSIDIIRHWPRGVNPGSMGKRGRRKKGPDARYKDSHSPLSSWEGGDVHETDKSE